MPTVNDVLYCAQQWIGYSRWTDPEEGTVFGRWYAEKTGESYYGASGVPYCAMFASYCLDWAGVSAEGIPGAYVPWILSANSDAGRLVYNEDAQPGDLVMFDWGGDGVADHIGIVEENHPDEGWMQTIEGNTSSGTSGSQSNGGGVYRRARNYSSIIGVARPYYDETSTAPIEGGFNNNSDSEASDSGSSAGLDVDGIWGPATTRAVQSALGTPVDGIVSGQSTSLDRCNRGGLSSESWQHGGGGSYMVEALQSKIGVDADGYFGPASCRALQSYLGTYVDGYVDYPSNMVKELQRRLNDGTF